MQFNRVLKKSVKFLFSLVCFLLLMTVVDRIGSERFVPWNIVWIVSGFYIALTGISLWFSSPVSTIEAAAEIDHRLHLQDRISSAISCEDSATPFSYAVIEDAIETTQENDVQSNISTYFPLSIPKEYSVIAIVGLIAAAMLWTGQWGLWSQNNQQSPDGLITSNENIESSIEAVLEQLENDELLSESLNEELSELASTQANNTTLDTETLRREALRKITDVQKGLEELLQDENAFAYEEMRRRMQSLKMPQQTSVQPMVADLKNANFDKAKKEFERLGEEMESSELSEEERKELAKAFENLAKQLEQLSKSNEEFASALSAAGLNGNFANNPDAAMKAIQNAKDLTEEQKKKLLELLKAQQQAAKMCKNMSKGCKQCASGKAGEGMGSEMGRLAAMQMFKKQAEMAKRTCQNAAQGMCNSSSNSPKPGTSGQGMGSGGSNPLKETETTTISERSPVQTLDGTIIAKQLFEGGLLTSGDSNAEVRETVLTQQRDAEQAIVDEEVPRRYHELLRYYFGQLEELTEPSNEDDTESAD